MICPPGQHVEEMCVPDPVSVPTWTDLGLVPAIAASPTATGRQIVQLTPFAGRVYLGYGDWNDTRQPGCDVIAWDVSSASFVTLGHVASDALWSTRVVGDELWVLTTDPEVGADPDAFIVRVDGTTRVLKGGRSPYPWHLFDVTVFNGTTYIAGSYRTQTKDGLANQGWATVWVGQPQRSGDPLWVPSLQVKSRVRAHSVFVCNGLLWVTLDNGQGHVRNDDDAWHASSVKFPPVVTKPLAVGPFVYLRSWWPSSGPGRLYRFDGMALNDMGMVQDHAADDDGTLWTLTATAIRRNSDVICAPPAGAISLCVVDGTVYVGTADSHLWRWS